MWRLTQLSFENYRTFERPETLEIRPLTVLIGRNSSGKSAIARLPSLLRRGLSGDASAPLEDDHRELTGGVSFLDLVSDHIATRGISLGLEASNGAYVASLRFTVGYWEEFRLQGLRHYEVAMDGVPQIHLQWSGTDDPRRPMRYEDLHPSRQGAMADCSFRGLLLEKMPLVMADRDVPLDEYNPSLTGFSPVIDGIWQSLSRLRYLGPFRDAPGRDDSIPEGTVIDLGARGVEAGKILASDLIREGGKVVQQVGEWYRKELGGWQLDLERDGRRFSVVLRSPRDPNITVNLRDAGVGLSQVLPVVVQHEIDRVQGTLGTLNVVEQPELHLHPGAHGALADLYLEATRRTGGQFIVETHSENFILRIRRRIAEGAFSPRDVAVYWVNDNLSATPRVRPIHIDEKGEVDFWPRGVFAEDLEEVQAIRRAQKDRPS